MEIFLNKLLEKEPNYFLHCYKTNKYNKYVINNTLSSYDIYDKIFSDLNLNFIFNENIKIDIFSETSKPDIFNDARIIYIDSINNFKNGKNY